MKKYLFLIAMALLTAMSFVSCSSSDDNNISGGGGSGDEEWDLRSGTYSFYEPCLQWGATIKEVEAYMAKQGDYVNEDDEEDDKWLLYFNPKTKSNVDYEFQNGKLCSASVTYFSCLDKYEQMKNDWARKLNLTWAQFPYFEQVFPEKNYFEADCAEKNCKVTIQKGDLPLTIDDTPIKFMVIDFTVAEEK